jgi:large subunit ribosomal protein L10
MPPRLRLHASKRLRLSTPNAAYPSYQCRYASLAAATTPAPSIESTGYATSPISRHPPTQPPPYKPAEFRKTQLHRIYTSLIRSSPLMLVFQHNNLKASEFAGIRRQMNFALEKVDAELSTESSPSVIGKYTELQIVQTGIFASAVKVAESFNPESFSDPARSHHPQDPATNTSTSLSTKSASPQYTHSLSKSAWKTARSAKAQTGLEPLLSGPLVVLTFPLVSPQHLKAAMTILSPSEAFPAPKRKANPGLYEPGIQSGLQKIMLLGARVEGKVFDLDGTKWIGGISGGLDGLRAQLVYMLQSLPATLTNTLEGAAKSLYVTVESRRLDMEPKEDKAEAEKKEE